MFQTCNPKHWGQKETDSCCCKIHQGGQPCSGVCVPGFSTTASVMGGERSLPLDQQDGILRNFSQSHNLPSSPIHSFGPSQQNRPPSHKSHRKKKPETADQFFESLPLVRLTWAPGHTESGQSFNPHRRTLLCEYHQASQPRGQWLSHLSFKKNSK